MTFIRMLHDIRINDVGIVGGKNASLGEMISQLSKQGVRVPLGFATTSEAFRYFMRENQLDAWVKQQLQHLDTNDMQALHETGDRIRQRILQAALPQDFEQAIIQGYQWLEETYHEHDVAVAIRSSATAEDLPNASFAGQQESYLYVQGRTSLLEHIRNVFASLFTDRAISYRVDQGFGHDIALSACVQKMVRSDKACSGVMFTLDTETGFQDAILITGSYGLGETIVQGQVNPDEFYVFKPSLAQGPQAILSRNVGEKAIEMVKGNHQPTGLQDVAIQRRQQFCLSDEEVHALARFGQTIENHYSRLAEHWQPMDIEWAKDGISGELFIVQARPETIHNKAQQTITQYHIKESGTVLLEGKSVGQSIASGKVRIIKHASDMHQFQAGEVLVTDMTDPDWEPIMNMASAIITNRGGRTCHAAIIARELGVPAIVGTRHGTNTLAAQLQHDVTVSCADGETGKVYQGALAFETLSLSMDITTRPRTHICMNIARPDHAFAMSQIPNDGVGLARLEFIVGNSIGIHPLALLHPEQLDNATYQRIAARAAAYPSLRDFYVQKLREGISMLAAAFHPKPVIVRLSDFKSSEYRHLWGGEYFEPIEDNAMLGLRGASRYRHPMFQEAFAWECQALLEARRDMHLPHIHIMVPFVRTLAEAESVLAIMAKHGLVRGHDGLRIYMMCEIPSNMILAEQFLDMFDGFSIGSNDLTQLMLGVDRNSEQVAELFDECDPAMLQAFERIIHICKARGKYVGICGQGPSDRPELARFLVEQGIDAISLNPDSILQTTRDIIALEQS